MDESNLKGFDYSIFSKNRNPSYNIAIYEVFDANALESGSYNCKVTLDIANGDSLVVRDFDFSK